MLSINDSAFWKQRLEKALENQEIHRSVFDIGVEKWNHIQKTHKQILPRYLRPGMRVLDAGCGYGSLLEILPSDIEYLGIDASPDLIREAEQRHPNHQFVKANLRYLPSSTGLFDVVICRSIKGMVCEHLGESVWNVIQDRLLSVAPRLILLNYSDPKVVCVLDGNPINPYTVGIIEKGCSRLIYRCGAIGTVELCSIRVEESGRRRGVGTTLVNELCNRDCGTVYGFTRASNTTALAFYEKLGFSLIPVPYFYQDEDGVLFRKRC